VKGIEQVDQPVLKRLKREDVRQTLATLAPFITDARWLGLQNRYAKDPIKTIDDEVEKGRILSPGQLSEYIAASCLLHCSDGWSYLGRAISALLRGDPHRARHLAYYAELRAATALLATEGVGVFHTNHFAITGTSKATQLATKKGTHIFAWDCLEFWAEQPSSANLFAQIIRPYGLSLESWCSPLGGATALAPHARKWFKQWGMDLRIFHDDHIARNISSYQPDGLPRIWSLDGHSVIKFVKGLWEALEPSPACRFDGIDQQILRISLEKYFTARTGRSAATARPRFRKFVSPAVEGQGLSEEINKQWLQFMNREVNPSDMEIFRFSQRLPDDMAFSAFAVMSRATLLLRAASGSTSRLFQEANHPMDSFKFWWEKFGLARGLWQGEKDADELQDLYVDIRESLTDIETFQAVHPEGDQTFFRLGEDVSKAVIALGSCERVALWSMAP
jgi:hypothetical protein